MPQRVGWTREGHLTRVGHLDFQHRSGGDRGRRVARLLLDDRWVGDLQETEVVLARMEVCRRVLPCSESCGIPTPDFSNLAA